MSDRRWIARLRGQMLMTIALFAGLLLAALPQPAMAREPSVAPATNVPPATASAMAARRTQPLAFEENRGQSDPTVHFLARARGYTLFLTESETVFTYSAETTLRFAFAGANPNPAVTAEQPTGATVSYFIGDDPSQWHAGVQTNAKIRYTGLYPGIDLVYYGDAGGQLEYDAIVAPGADPSLFAFTITGADAVSIGPEGDLLLQTASGEVRQHAPIITQEINGIRRPVAGGFDLRADGTVGFQIGVYDPTAPLIIDPTVVIATYDGGTGYDQANAVAADATGNFYFDGYTTGPTSFNAAGGYHAPTSGGKDVFITKFGPTGTHLADAIVGGTADDVANGLIFDPVRNLLYVVGETPSTGFPTTAGVFKPNCATGGQKDGFVLALDPTLATLLMSTCVGNTSGTTHNTSVKSVALSGSNVILVGPTGGGLPITTGPAYAGGTDDLFVASLNSAFAAMNFLLYDGGSGDDIANKVSVFQGGVFVAGQTTSTTGIGTTGSYQPTTIAGTKAFVTAYDATTGAKQWGTFLAGTQTGKSTYGMGVAASASGVWIVGNTNDSTYPTTAGALQTTFPGFGAATVTKVNLTGTALIYSTFVVGDGTSNSANDVAVDSAGNAYVVGSMYGDNMPVTANAIQQHNGGLNDIILQVFGPTGSQILGTYYGGPPGELGYSIAVDPTAPGTVIIAGVAGNPASYPPGSPLVNAFQTTYGGDLSDNYFVKIANILPTGLFSFTAQTIGGIGTNPTPPAVGDFNGDGTPDMATFTSTGVNVLLNNGHGVFSQAPGSPFAASGTIQVIATDINRDGKGDLVTFTTSHVFVYLGLGNGTFGSPISTALDLSHAAGFGVADFNNDGFGDLVYVDFTTNVAALALNNGLGFFLVPQFSGTGGSVPNAAAIVDVNNDNDLDLVVSNSGSSSVTVLMGGGHGSLTLGATITSCPNAADVAVGDVNHDSKPDIITACTGDGTHPGSVIECTGDGAGAFPVCTPLPGISPRCVATGDLDGDGKEDIAACDATSDEIAICQGDGGGNCGSWTYLTGLYDPHDVVLTDENGDGKPDMIITDLFGSGTVVEETNTETPFPKPTTEVHDVFPSHAPRNGGDTITIKGSGFRPGLRIVFVAQVGNQTRFVPQTNVTVSPDGTTMTFTVPQFPDNVATNAGFFITDPNTGPVWGASDDPDLSKFYLDPSPSALPQPQPAGPPANGNPAPEPVGGRPQGPNDPIKPPPLPPGGRSVGSRPGASGVATPVPLPGKR